MKKNYLFRHFQASRLLHDFHWKTITVTRYAFHNNGHILNRICENKNVYFVNRTIITSKLESRQLEETILGFLSNAKIFRSNCLRLNRIVDGFNYL
jgi:hypothetical protein